MKERRKNVKDALHKGVHMKNRIEEIRKVRGINQEELAKVLGVEADNQLARKRQVQPVD